MNAHDFAGHASFEVASRVGRILPVLRSQLELDDQDVLTEVQEIALGSTLIVVFDGLNDTLESMADMGELLGRMRKDSYLDAEIDRLLGGDADD